MVHRRDNSELQLLQQFGFQPDTAGAFLEMPTADQEGVFDPLAQRRNLRRMQAGAMPDRGRYHGQQRREVALLLFAGEVGQIRDKAQGQPIRRIARPL